MRIGKLGYCTECSSDTRRLYFVMKNNKFKMSDRLV